MFDNIKKFVRKHKYKFIIAEISIALVGAFLAWLVDLSFLAVTILSFIWSAYFCFLGTEQTLDKNETNEKKSGENLGVPENQIQTYVPITKELVYGYVAEMVGIGWMAALNQKSQLVTVHDGSTRIDIPIYCVLTLHFQKIPWQTYSLDEIIFDVKSIIGVLTGTEINAIDEYLNRYLENPTDKTRNKELRTTKKLEEQLKKFDSRGGRVFWIRDLDKLIKKIESRYQATINKLENPSPNLKVTSELNNFDL